MDNTAPYQDINALVLLYNMGDLPENIMAFPYYSAPGKVAWAHVDEIKRQAALAKAYPTANTTKAAYVPKPKEK